MRYYLIRYCKATDKSRFVFNQEHCEVVSVKMLAEVPTWAKRWKFNIDVNGWSFVHDNEVQYFILDSQHILSELSRDDKKVFNSWLERKAKLDNYIKLI